MLIRYPYAFIMAPLITGGCGFIGSHVAQLHTEAGTRVMVLDDLSSGKHSNLTHRELTDVTVGDVADSAALAPLVERASVVFHLAAIASVVVCAQEPEKAHRTNVTGTQTLFAAVASAQKKTGRTIPVIYASSAAIYGDNPNIPLSESATPSPINSYGEQKLENEHIAARAAEQGVASVGLRFFNVYGPRQDPSSPYSGVISKFVDGALAGRNLTIFGDGEQTRDFIYVGDVVHVLRDVAASASGATVYNVCTGQATNLKQLARIIGELSGRGDIAIDYQQARAGDIRHSLGDATKIQGKIGNKNWTPLAKGL